MFLHSFLVCAEERKAVTEGGALLCPLVSESSITFYRFTPFLFSILKRFKKPKKS